MKAWTGIVCAALAAAGLNQGASAAEWVATWGAAPLPPTQKTDFFPGTPSYANQTIRQVVRITAGGTRVRVRLTNEFGTKPLVIGAARIALADEKGNIKEGTDHALTFAGQNSTIIPQGAPMLSDAVDMPVNALSTLSISIFLPEDTGLCTCHQTGMQTAYVSDTGDFTSKPFTPKSNMLARAFISGVEVESAAPARVIAVLGDSISDGVGSTNDSNHRWPDLLAERLAANNKRTAWGVVNMGISGNRVLTDGAGQNALARFDRDVLSLPGLTHIIVFLGVNDLGISYGDFDKPSPLNTFFKSQLPPRKATAETMIAAYRQLITRAHAKGVKIYGATIAPYDGSFYYTSAGNAVREEVNKWMRTSRSFDAVLDFDAVFRDPAKPTAMSTPLQSGDHLHGSDAGYEAVAKSIDLALFK